MLDFRDKTVALLGFGLEAQALLPYLQERGAKVTVCDQKTGLNIPGVELRLGPDYLNNVKFFDVIFRSPGISFWKPEIQEAFKTGTLVTSQIKYFIHETRAKIIGVTGTKGKSTTASIIKAILDKAKERGEITGNVYLGGNIGVPVIDLLDKATAEDWVVLELSSFQLQDLDKSPHVAVVLPITDDHLDYHESREEYVDSKRNIVRYQTPGDFLITNTDMETVGTRVGYDPTDAPGDPLLPGKHNLENFSAAAAAARTVGASEESIADAIFTFRGLPHRLQYVTEKNGVKYYDDSKSTTPESTIAAISSFTEPIVLILGGKDKGLDYANLVAAIKNSNVKRAVCIGEVGAKLLGDLDGVRVESNMFDIVKKAAEIAEPGDVVLLSPAAASFDMFKNAEDRGEQFQHAVANF